ncbi:hypothetical protein [Sphingomonas solaris]|uniref:Uncharacterized protein n=1 Tax=Alterirhizorhabdus solaris TaxID=2529389 RepID=A0A558R1N2_9SPHN|nr:hypothetical protein [Sphingomonas solaris]TVV73287.1 hypothetical protein FOY91_12615 [Sphingomonas solaris]
MFKLFVVAVSLTAAASPALAGEVASSPFRFEANGTTFAGTRTEDAGVITLRGQEQGGKPFRLKVKNNRVTGTFGASPVSFPVPAAQADMVTALR